MVYSSGLRRAIGQVRSALASIGIGTQSRQFAEHGEHRPQADAPLVLVACSGGRDSMALAALTHTVCASMGVRAGAVIIDHQLQVGSGDAARGAAHRCAGLGLSPVVRVEIDVRSDGRGEEAEAREARYAALVRCARWFGAAAVLLAHTQDDQAETVLIDLMRSSSVGALAGMPAVARRDGVTFLRPLLAVTRGETTGICEDLGLAWWDDPTNGDGIDSAEPLPDAFPLRSRVRHTLMPALSRFFGGDIARHLAQGTAVARQDESYLEAQADVAYERIVTVGDSDSDGSLTHCGNSADAGVAMNAKALAAEHPAIASRVLLRVFASLGLACGASQVKAVLRLAYDWHGQGPVSLPSGYSANRKKHVIRVCKNRTHANR